MRVSRGGRVLVLVLVGLVLSSTGCASMPESGQVHEVRVQPQGEQDPHVRVFALSPQDDEDPSDIVNGFLEALTSDEAGFDTARRYLTPKARETWRPDAGTIVFRSQLRTPLSEESRDTVRLSANEAARVDPSGLYTPSVSRTLTVHFALAQEKGQWRIASLPNGVYVSEFDFQRLYQRLNLYFFDPDRRVLVPDPVYVSTRPGQLASVIRRLVRGPSSLLSPAVTSYFPRGTELVGDSVPVEGGVPRVRLNAAALRSSPKEREAMTAQLVWTLAQLGFKEVRITAEGGDFSEGGAPETASVQQYSDLDPSAVPFPPVGYFERNGKLLQLVGDPLAPVPGPFGTGRSRVHSFAVSGGNDKVAAVSADGTSLVVGDMVEGTQTRVYRIGQALTRPSWDGQGRIWVVDHPTVPGHAASRVWLVSDQGAPQPVLAPELAGAVVRDLRVARDGTRVAVLREANGKKGLWVGRVERRIVESTEQTSTTQLVITGLRQIATQLVDVRDVSWSEPGQLTVLAEDSQGVLLPYTVYFDGSGLEAGESGPGRPMVSLAATEDRPLLTATDDGTVWQLERNDRWVKRGPGRTPFYPG